MDHSLFIVGLNHRTAPVAVRERLAFAEDEAVGALVRLRREAPSVAEAALVSTCNRVEVIGVAADAERATAEVVRFLVAARGVALETFVPALYRLEGRAAVRHLFRVGASLDSMVVGEPQILGQLKGAYAQAAAAGCAGLVLHRAFHKTFSVAKRVRKETLVGRGSVSIGSAAVALAQQIFDRLNDKKVMLLGAGELAEITARNLKQLDIEALLISSRTFSNAVAVAEKLGGTAVPFDGFRPYLKMADVVIGSLAVAGPVLGPEEFESLIRERRYRPIFLIDLGVPRNFDPRLNALENVYLYDIDDLGAVVLNTREEREREAERAETIVELELESFLKWLEGLDLVPTIKDIRGSIEQLRELELDRHRAWLSELKPDERARIERLAQDLTNKLLHRILSGLKSAGSDGLAAGYAAELARRMLCGQLALTGAARGPGGETDDEEL